MSLLTDLDDARRDHVESRLRTNLIAWFTSVDPDGHPTTVPVWFLWQPDESFLVYTQARTPKLRNLAVNPNVSLALDVSDIGRDVITFEGTATHDPDRSPADQVAAYAAKYAERTAAIFGSVADFAAVFTAPIVIHPTRARISTPSPGATAGR